MLYGSVLLFLLYCVDNGILLEETKATVKQETRCGTIASELSADNLQLLIIGGRSGQRGEVPWHAGVYTKTTRPYQQICGGSLISNDVILSAAHCFWNLRKDQQEPAENYAVAAGKLYRPWNDIIEKGQHSDVREIHLPIYFRGSVANYQDDIAVVIILSRFTYDTFVRPICVDFDVEIEQQQLRAGHNGTVAGWGLTEENGKSSQVLKVIEMPYVNTETCIAKSPPSYLSYITSDKICAGYMNAGLALCKGDSGGGLAFPRLEDGSTQYYLRGIVSSAPTSDNVCNANFYTSFTRLQKHEQFIKQFWPRLNCVLPPYPKHGSYEVNKPNAKPGDSFDDFIVNVTCSPGWGMQNRGNGSIFMCYNGWWAEKMPNRCDLLCILRPHYSVIYSCVDGSVPGGSRECTSEELPGTKVKVRCRTPEFYSIDLLRPMQCINGKWSSNPRCKSAQCGTVSVESEEHQLPTAGWSAKRGEVPWHAGIYSKTVTPYRQICGGSLISRTAVISAAQCFWTIEEGIKPVTQYAVAVGKLYRPWDDEKDEAQRSDVQEIVPGEYFQAWTADQQDIALVKVIMAFNFTSFVQPVCVDFDKYLNIDQLQPERFGKIAGWGITDEYGNMSQGLKVTELPYVSLETALTAPKLSYNSFITDDKFYAGYADGRSSMCTEDSGGGLSFPHLEDGVVRYYLRGVLSTGPSSEPVCNLYTYATFTNIQKHETFLETYFESESLDYTNYGVKY